MAIKMSSPINDAFSVWAKQKQACNTESFKGGSPFLSDYVTLSVGVMATLLEQTWLLINPFIDVKDFKL